LAGIFEYLTNFRLLKFKRAKNPQISLTQYTNRQILHTKSGCDIGGDSDCKVGGAAERRRELRERAAAGEWRDERESSSRRAGERVSETDSLSGASERERE
jgi:hypothetical protein